MKQSLKLIVSGPVGAGKTTFISTLSETAVVQTDELASENIGKERTTVAMDFGSMKFGETVLYLFGTPGQDRFDFMWEVLCEGALGIVLLVSGTQPQGFTQARNILEFIVSRVPVPFIVGVTHQDTARAWSSDDVADYMGIESNYVVGLNATDRKSSVQLLIRLLANIQDAEA